MTPTGHEDDPDKDGLRKATTDRFDHRARSIDHTEPDTPIYAESARPDPPYSVEVLADLHAGVLPPPVAAHVRTRLNHPDYEVLEALDLTVYHLNHAELDVDEVPPDVAARTHATLAALELSAIREHAPATHTRDMQVVPITPRRSGVWTRLVAAAAVVLAVVAVGFGVAGFGSGDPTSVDADGAPPSASPTTPTAPTTLAALSSAEQTQLLRALGNQQTSAFGSEQELRECLRANDVPDATAVLGSDTVDLRGQSATVILLATGVAGRFDALVVGPLCSQGNPSFINRTTIGG